MASDQRADRLRKTFRNVLSGGQQVKSTLNAQHFLEAIRAEQPPGSCIERLVSSKKGLDSLRDAIRMDVSESFILSHTLPFLDYLSDPTIKTLVDGQLLRMVLEVIANPPTVWNAALNMFRNRKMAEDLVTPFAWLAFELLSLPLRSEIDVLEDVQAISERIIGAQQHETREFGYKIQRVLQARCSPLQSAVDGPGGRHDNDHENYRNIRIYPTTDEFLSSRRSFYLTAQEVLETGAETRVGVHLANQFRLLREDMVAELREDHQVATGVKKGKRSSLVLGRLRPVGLDFGGEDDGRFRKPYKKCTLLLQCFDGLQILQKKEIDGRKKYLKDKPQFLRHQAFGVLCRGNEIIAFAFVDRDIERLAKDPAILSLQFTDSYGLRNALLSLSLPNSMSVQFALVDTAVFAYEPVLVGLQGLTDLPLQQVLVSPTSADSVPEVYQTPKLKRIIDKLKPSLAVPLAHDDSVQLQVSATKNITVDRSQHEALFHALTSSLSLIQGPPGTGKSFIGAIIAKLLFDSGKRILVVSYTNHALDQFLEDLLNEEIPANDILRIGAKAKCTPKTLPLLLSEQKGGYKRSHSAWEIIDQLRCRADVLALQTIKAFRDCRQFLLKWEALSEYLEFSDEDSNFYEAFQMPTSNDNWQLAGNRNQKVGPDYLYTQWMKGRNPGVYGKNFSAASKVIWAMSQKERQGHLERWTRSLVGERLDLLEKHASRFNGIQDDITDQFSEADASTMSQKRIIGCTTTGAAKYSKLIRAAKPDVVLVEEAGEILESHILTALAPSVQQLILIGDHKQLRPKINNYALSVERGDGFDLNRSLFERLIMQGASHKTLHKQHRMAPEISRFPRELTYPGLVDGPKTGGRQLIRGLRDRVVFINHGKPEASDQALSERRDPGVKESKQNPFEADMVLRCIKYFGQQGYASHNIVILTPYLGQLRLIQDLLRENEHDPELSEMDKRDLIRAGLLSEAAAIVDRKPLRISTIDNYQGEESDIVIASLTRSNASGDIGFMSAPERLNVLITRARNCLVLIGNMETFIKSKKGITTWHPFFEILKTHGHLYDGLPVKCEKHPERTALLREPIDFDKASPDGGCTEPCNALLKCGAHKCKSKCHRVTDHSQAQCNQPVDKVCDRQHKTRVVCSRSADGCRKCIQEDRDHERRIKRDLQLEEQRQKRQESYARELQELDDEIDHERRLAKYKVEEEDQKKTLEQRRVDLGSMKETQKRIQEQEKRKEILAAKVALKASKEAARKSTGVPEPSSDAGFDAPEDARSEWEQLKKLEGARSDPLDELMRMIGLEDVKQEFLSIKSRVDLTTRQNTSLATDRFSCSMLGNPGTGKTTVARIYAKFLTEVGVIPGTCFKETTGASLANIGVSGCKKLIEEILNEGGGVLFLDEAYQLTSGNNMGGGAVLDHLLTEVENLRGKVVFVLAGYNKQMESFFAHNPGLPSRFPIQMDFADYSDDELRRILELKVNGRFNGLMDCDGGLHGLYCRIIARRVGYGRGKDGFGNARTVENTLSGIYRRQADRLRRERKAGNKPDDMFLTKEDLIGPEPTNALTACAAWKKLQELTGLNAVKEAVSALVDSIQENYKRELAEHPPIQYSLNKVFLGNPGTGKTTVAKLYGQILVALGLLSRGEVVVKNPSDFVGAALGQSEQNTKGILASAIGKVLVIDEAYGLYGGGDNQGSSSDPYKTAVIDTIVAEVQSVPGDDRCVLLLGYKDQMETMFQNVNPGLSRRFPIASGFVFDDFTQEELRKILDLKLKQQGYQATEQAARVAMEMLDRARNRPNFGNAGEIDILLDATKARHQKRISRNRGPKGTEQSNSLLEPRDFDENFDRAERSDTNIGVLFRDTVGSEQIVGLLESYQETVRTMKSLDMDPKENIPFNFLFRGPPGTGKTTTAKKMGKVFYDMGFLATAEVEECSATDLIGQYVGQTGPKVQKLLDKALGRVLFVDEAYRLAEGHFAKEAMDELVDSVTKARYYKKLIIILAGYDADINRLMSVNAGLTSRFPAVINFRPLTPEECFSLLLQLLQKQRASIQSKGKDFDLTCLESPTGVFRQRMISDFGELAAQDNWASARDVQCLAKEIFNKVLRSKVGLAQGRLVLDEQTSNAELETMLNERKSRSQSATTADLPGPLQQPLRQDPPAPLPPRITRSTATVIKTQGAEPQEAPPEAEEETQASHEKEKQDSRHLHDAQRDAGVSDEVWEQLQQDRRAEEEREEEYQRLKEEARKASDAARERIVKRLAEEEMRRREEEERKRKLAALGICPAGYQWIKESSGGYRCAGGSHYLSDADLERA